MKSVIYLIEGGKALELIKRHIEEVRRVRHNVLLIAEELGITEGQTNPFTGVMTSVVFNRGEVPEGWTKPDRKHGVSRPKIGSPTAARFAAQVGYPDPAKVISTELGIPIDVNYSSADGGQGSKFIGGSPFRPCGWLYCSGDGPFALFAPDVVGEVKALTDKGYTVKGDAASFTGAVEGCRRIEHEEWDIVVAQHALQAKRENAKAETEGGAA
jgi:hypothetical protein